MPFGGAAPVAAGVSAPDADDVPSPDYAATSGLQLVRPHRVKSSCLTLRNGGDDCFMNVVLQLLKRASFEDHLRTCCVGEMHEELRKLLSGEKDVVGHLRGMLSSSELHKGVNSPSFAFVILLKDLAVECKNDAKVPHPMRYKSHVVCSVQGCTKPKPSNWPLFCVKLPKGKSFTDMVLQKPWECKDHLGKSAMIEKKIIADKFNSNFIWIHVDSAEGRYKQMRMKDNQEFIIFGEHCRLVGFLDVKIVPEGLHGIVWIHNGGGWSRVSDHHKKEFWSTSFDMDSIYAGALFLFERK